MPKKPGFTMEQHREVGPKLKQARLAMKQASVEIDNAYPKSSRAGGAAKLLDDALSLLEKARYEMDEQVVLDFPDLTVQEFAPIYYGPEK